MVKDEKEGIDTIEWTVYGKISKIVKGSMEIRYSYDATGNRISKEVDPAVGATPKTYYVRDGSGNVMSVYEEGGELNEGNLSQSEVHLYGSSRLGIFKRAIDMTGLIAVPDGVFGYERGHKFFELSNHLGNVLVTVTDRKNGVAQSVDTTLVDYYLPDMASASDYYPFGMTMPGRKLDSDKYRYGFNGKENDAETGLQDYGMRIYNPALGRFLSVDPLTPQYSMLTPYQFSSDNPIQNIDVDGLEGRAFQAEAKAKKYGPNALRIQTVDEGFGDVQTQLYSLKAHGSLQEFSNLKQTMLTSPQNITNNTYAKYWPVRRDDTDPSRINEGDEIEILPKIGPIPIQPVHVLVRVVQVESTEKSFEMTFATLEGHPEAGYVKFSGSFNEQTGELSISILTETRETWGISKIGPSRTLQKAQWREVIGNMREALGKEKKDVKETEQIQVFEYDENQPMGKGNKKNDTTKPLNE